MLAVDTRLPHAATPAQERDHARTLARAALTRALAAQLGCAPQALSVSDERGQPPRLAWATGGAAALGAIGLSISHAPALSLAAWRLQGAVGVDLQAVPQEAKTADLLHTAALYLGQNTAETLANKVQSAHFSIIFTQCWAQYEAALKCLGLGLAEYTPALAAQLAHVQTVRLALPAWAPGGLVAALAWRPITTP